MEQHSGKSVVSKKYIKIENGHLTCPLCKNLFRDATTLNVCLDTSCKDCIYHKPEDDNSNCCPDCKTDLGSSPIETLRKNCNVTKSRGQQTKVAPKNLATSQEKTGKVHDVMGEKNFDVDQTPSPQSSESVTSKMQDTNERQNQKCQARHNEAAFDSTDEVLTKKKRNTKRRPRQHSKGDDKIESSIIIAELLKPGPDGIERSIDAEEHSYKEELSEEFSNPLWFCLLACGQETGNELPQIPKQYIKIKDGNMPVSYINKYLVQKLNLQHESEVDVMCCGEPLIPSLTLNELKSIWMHAKFGRGEVNINLDEGIPDGEDFVMQLTYQRSKEH